MEAVMADWLLWPADLLLQAGGVVAGLVHQQRCAQFHSRAEDGRNTGAGSRRMPACIFANVVVAPEAGRQTFFLAAWRRTRA